jgi:hypothetical protein
MNKYFHKEIINLIKMQIKSVLFCLATILVVFTSAGPVGLSDGSSTVSKSTLENPVKGGNLEEALDKVGEIAGKLQDAN